MTFPQLRTHSETHVRCGTPDCDWGTPLANFSAGQLKRCRREFRKHCIERHGLDPNDVDRFYWFDLEALTLTLLESKESQELPRP
jgi:hypothetical protein